MANLQRMNCVVLLILLFSVASQAEVRAAPETCAKTGGASGCGVSGISLIQKSVLSQKTRSLASVRSTKMEEEKDISLLEEDDEFIDRATDAEWKFEEKLPMIIAGSVAAITEATPYFEKKLEDDPEKPDPKAIVGGILVLAKHLYKVFHNGFIELVEKETPGFDWEKFRTNWIDLFESIPKDVQEVEELLEEFSLEGKTHALIQAIGMILDRALTRVNKFLPKKAQKDVAKFGGIVTKTVNSIGKSWAAFESGDGAKGAEAMYEGIKGNVDALLPKKLQNDATYKTIMGTVDKQMGKLSETVMKFKKKMTESRVCIKKSRSRRYKRPKVCPKGMILQGKLCKSMGSRAALISLMSYFGYSHEDLHLDSAKAEEAEEAEEGQEDLSDEKEEEQDVTAALQKRAEVGKSEKTSEVEESLTGKDDEDKIYAECDDESQYPDLYKGRCYKVCQEGYVGAGKVCSEECTGKFPVGDGDWCGKSKQAIDNAKMQIVISAINAAASIAITIASAVSASKSKDKDAMASLDFSSTIDTLTNAAVAFVFPECSF